MLSRPDPRRCALALAVLAATLFPAAAEAKLSLEFDRETARPGERVTLAFGDYFTSTRNVVHVYLVRAAIIGDVIRPALGGGASRLGPPARRAGVHKVGRTLSGRSGITFPLPALRAGRYAAVLWCSTCANTYLLAAHQGGIPDDAYVRPTRSLLTVRRAEIPTRSCEARIEAGDAPLRFPPSRSGSIFAGPLAFSGLSGCYPLDVQVVGGRTYRVRIPLGRPCR